MSDNLLINAVDVHFSYEEEKLEIPVLNGVNFKVKKGEFVALLGHNGSGKSTFAKHFNALLLPSGGKVYVTGIDTSDEDKKYDIRQKVGMVLQNPDNQLVATIVEEDVAFGPEGLGLKSGEIRKRVDDALKAVGMYEYKDHAPHKLSGGQKQRVAIAGIIAMQPSCIVFDEPTAMLDPSGRREVMETIVKLKEEKNIATVLITHYMDEAVKADRVVVMDKGRILIEGAPSEVFKQSRLLKEHNLDVPQAVQIADGLEKFGINPYGILDEESCAQAIYQAWRRQNARN